MPTFQIGSGVFDIEEKVMVGKYNWNSQYGLPFVNILRMTWFKLHAPTIIASKAVSEKLIGRVKHNTCLYHISFWHLYPVSYLLSPVSCLRFHVFPTRLLSHIMLLLHITLYAIYLNDTEWYLCCTSHYRIPYTVYHLMLLLYWQRIQRTPRIILDSFVAYRTFRIRIPYPVRSFWLHIEIKKPIVR